MLEPIDIRVVGTGELLITWTDEHRSIYPLKILRLICPCAQCVDERTGLRVMTEDKIPQDLHLKEASPVGRYGLRFEWSDRHNTGIYPFEWLRRYCHCPACIVHAQNSL